VNFCGFCFGFALLFLLLCLQMRLLGLDGLYLNASRVVQHLPVLQSGRVSLALMCPSKGTYYLQSATTFNASDPAHVIGDVLTKSSQNLLTLQVSGNVYVKDPPPTTITTLSKPQFVTPADLGGDYDLLSLSTAQGGCCGGNTNVSARNSCAKNTLFWMGLGVDCQPACYDRVLCSALQSVLTATESDSVSAKQSYDVTTFPTSRLNLCHYGTSNVCVGANDTENVATMRQLWSSTTDMEYTPLATAGYVQQIELWGHTDYPYPIFLQNHHMQVGGFGKVDGTVSNIIESGEYIPSLQQNSTFYASVGDWKETWPALTGKHLACGFLFVVCRFFTCFLLLFLFR
jgi:FtsP/CotA-like multicopper oxidase with cupredoxin domain